MLTLEIAREPRWLDVPQGVRLLAKPLDRITRAAAEGVALAEAKALLGEAAQQERTVFSGLYFMLLVRLIARRIVTAWEGVGADRARVPGASRPHPPRRGGRRGRASGAGAA